VQVDVGPLEIHAQNVDAVNERSESGAGTKQTFDAVRNNVRYWHKADIPAYVDLCLLSGVKRSSNRALLNVR
jgi:hypothetical protein